MPQVYRFAIRTLGAALILALDRAGWELHVPPGEDVYCERNGARIKPFVVIQDLASGKLSADEWKRQCLEAGIADVDLGEVAPTQTPPGG